MQLRHILFASLIGATSVSLFAASATDRKIEDAAKSSYNFRTVLEDQVTVKVNDGVVTLTGMVADKDTIALAEDTVSNLPGVTRVDNQVTLDPALKEYSDAWITWKIRYLLLVRASVSNRDSKVRVNEGVVTLTGTATTAAEKELVGVYAAGIEGVKSVENDIVIQAARADAKATVAEVIDDASITTQVKYALLKDESTSAIKTKVTTTDGVVLITGSAASAAEKALVSKLAQSIRGVKSVSNDMTVKS